MGQGKLIRESTKQGNDEVARNMESAHRTSLAKGEVGIREKKRANMPKEGWVWVAPTRSGHVESSSLKKQHAKAFAVAAKEASKDNLKPIRRFVLCSLRHTFLTRLGESGCDAWTLARIAGHSSIGISTRYVHPSEDAVLAAIEKLVGGHKSGRSDREAESAAATPRQLTQ